MEALQVGEEQLLEISGMKEPKEADIQEEEEAGDQGETAMLIQNQARAKINRQAPTASTQVNYDGDVSDHGFLSDNLSSTFNSGMLSCDHCTPWCSL